MNDHQLFDRSIGRRHLLQTIAGSCLATAGCLGIESGQNADSEQTSTTTAPPSGESAHIHSLSYETNDGSFWQISLIVELVEDTSIDEVSVVNGEGRLVGSKSLSEGVTEVALPIAGSGTQGDSISGGENTIVLNGESTEEIAFTFEPDVQIDRVALGEEYPEAFEKFAAPQPSSGIVVVLSNTGTGPDRYGEVTVVNGPQSLVRESFERRRFLEVSGFIQSDETVVIPLRGALQPGNLRECDEVDSRVATVTFSTALGENPTADTRFRYDWSDDVGCNVSIAGESTRTPAQDGD